jgi:hypothetical protein
MVSKTPLLGPANKLAPELQSACGGGKGNTWHRVAQKQEDRKGKGMDYYKSRYISYISISFPRLQLSYMVLKSKFHPMQ